MKHTKRAVVFLAALMVVCTLCLALTACNHSLDSEKRPFSMSISKPDGVFNPFFSTSGTDSEIISLTQIGMINTDANGKVVVGENEPTVAKAYTVTENEDNTTTYEFLIKNGIKFSDGSPLTIKDVLFNLYVYLDPVYTGAATIYSTDIVGLQAYRQQDPNADSSSASSFEAQFVTAANERVDADIEYVKSLGIITDGSTRPHPDLTEAQENKAILDYAFIAKTFYNELVSDWNAIDTKDYKDWKFTEVWQIFYLNDGGDNLLLARNKDGSYVKDDKGNYQLSTERATEIFNDRIGPELVKKNLAVENNGSFSVFGNQDDVDNAIKEFCINDVFSSKFSDYFPMSVVKRNENIVTLTEKEKDSVEQAIASTFVSDFEMIAKYWATATTVLDKFTKEAMSEHFAGSKKIISTISGIKAKKSGSRFGDLTLTESYDILSITINGVDPKAIYNFGFTVAPMWYYSTTNWNGKNYIASFDAEKGEFGLEFANSTFMDEVVHNADKIGLPMGAGPYKACSKNGADGTSETFSVDNMVYYVRNDFFHTTGEGIENAKIKYVRYKVLPSEYILSNLTTKQIDFGNPNATAKNEQELKQNGIITEPIKTNGYGYVGINPRFVPDVNVRRAIMKAFDVNTIVNNYYEGGFGEKINRPMSTVNWAYPQGVGVYKSRSSADGIGSKGESYAFDSTGKEIERLVMEAGYTKVNGVYQREIKGFGTHKLDYKFTIAGGSTDHPAYSMFLDAAELLNAHGFAVKVVTSNQALTDLTSGKLAVWAAAWSSTIDPDMFQVYHKDSQASSVKNWGYPQILGQTNSDAWGDEYGIVIELSEIIDKARHTTVEDQRINYYHQALDLVMELAVEFPSYQRKDLFAYQSNLLDPNTLPKNLSPYSGLLARIWEIDYIKK